MKYLSNTILIYMFTSLSKPKCIFLTIMFCNNEFPLHLKVYIVSYLKDCQSLHMLCMYATHSEQLQSCTCCAWMQHAVKDFSRCTCITCRTHYTVNDFQSLHMLCMYATHSAQLAVLHMWYMYATHSERLQSLHMWYNTQWTTSSRFTRCAWMQHTVNNCSPAHVVHVQQTERLTVSKLGNNIRL